MLMLLSLRMGGGRSSLVREGGRGTGEEGTVHRYTIDTHPYYYYYYYYYYYCCCCYYYYYYYYHYIYQKCWK